MSEYIDREDVRRFFQLGENCDTCQRDAYECQYRDNVSLVDVCGMLDDIPAADVVEVRHGRWTDHRTIEHDGEWYCTACGEEVTICSCGKDKTWKYPYCPNCGAKMDGGADDAAD